MKVPKQKILLDYLVSSPDVFMLCNSILRPQYFDPEYRRTVQFIQGYFEEYKSLPEIDLIEAETDVKLKRRNITPDVIDYCTDEVEKFCRHKALSEVVLTTSKMVLKAEESDAEPDYGAIESMVREAVTISLNRDLGTDYFIDPLTRLQRQLTSNQKIPFGWDEFDDLLYGGISRGEMILFSANSGGGKSITLSNVALNYVERGYHVLYISLELSEDLISCRFDTMISGIGSAIWRDHVDAIAQSVTNFSNDKGGSLRVKYMPAQTNCNAIRAYLKEYILVHGRAPDLLVLDYLDLLGSNENVSADNVFEKDKRATEQYRNLLSEFNMVGATASQQNRSALDATELNHSIIAGGISKINTTDVYVSILLTDAMKAAGEIGFMFLKTRNSDGVGKTTYCKWDNSRLRISNREKTEDDAAIRTAVAATKAPNQTFPTRGTSSLLDVIDMH